MLSVELPPSLWADDIATCEHCGYEADLRPDPRIAIEQLRVTAKLLAIKSGGTGYRPPC